MSYNQFKADDWAALTWVERVGRCQVMNNETLIVAENAGPNEAEAYRVLARAWVKLADAIARGNG